MSNNQMVTFQENDGAALAPEFMPMVQDGLANDLSEGVGGGYAVVSIRAGKFRVKHKGNEFPITNDRGDPVGSIDVVLVRANAHITKQFFSKPYDEGDAAAPDCMSLDGVTPVANAPSPQARTCAVCPKNVFGSAPPRNGVASKGKACQDNRKLAILPLDDLANEAFGGPMLFRVPPTALSDLAQFGAAWKARGYPYNAIGVRIGMDLAASYPKPTFTAIRPLRSDEAQKVLEVMHTPMVEKILNDHDGSTGAPVPAVVDGPAFEDAAAEAESRAAPPAPAPAPAPQPAPATAPAAKVVFGKPAAAPAPAASTAPPAAQVPVQGATFGKAKVAQAPAAPAAPAPAQPAKPRAARKAAAPAAAPAPVVATVVEEATEEPSPPNADADIESILAELGQVAG
jgi:hypothetical protein